MKVFDASAVMALMKHEPGADAVAAAMTEDELWISAINYAEVLTSFLVAGYEQADVLQAWQQLQIQIAPLQPETALGAARLRVPTRHLGLSLGDRCCLALAQEHGATVITADRVWAGLPGFDIVLVR
jgi:PIN domain nuclease of toxin-antitoxin system